MKKIFMVLVCVLMNQMIHAQSKRVAMLETLAETNNVSVLVRNMMRAELTKCIDSDLSYHAFTRSNIDQMMEEFTFQTDMVSKDQRIKLGEMSGADLICVSKVAKQNKDYYIEAALIDLKTGKLQSTASGLLEDGNLSLINDFCKKIAVELLAYSRLQNIHNSRQNRSPEERTNLGLYLRTSSPLEGSQAVCNRLIEQLREYYNIHLINKKDFKSFKRSKFNSNTDLTYCLQFSLFYNSLKIFVFKKNEGELTRIIKTYDVNQKSEAQFLQNEVTQIIRTLNAVLPKVDGLN